MASSLTHALLQPRYIQCVNGYCRRRNRWFDLGRWIVLAIILFGFFIVVFLFACIARRRRRRGAQPMYGTGWMAPAGKYEGPNGQDPNYQQGYGQQGYGPPAYGHPQYPQNTGTTGTNFHTNDGYYGDASQQQYGVQQPPTAYQRDGTYSPPPGAPPAK